jgi:CTP:molybdopterin cytidylyltransferase MocA
MNKVGALVLAAGGARRFGAPKLRATLAGQAVLRWSVEAAVGAGLHPIVVVVGGDPSVGAEVEQFCLDQPAPAGADRIVMAENHQWARGMSTSVRVGIEALSRAGDDLDAACVLLGDQPAVGVPVISRLLTSARPDVVVVATFEGQRRNPLVVGSRLWDRARTLEGDTGFRALFDQLPLIDVACDGLGDPTDVDTPADLARLRRRWAREGRT